MNVLKAARVKELVRCERKRAADARDGADCVGPRTQVGEGLRPQRFELVLLLRNREVLRLAEDANRGALAVGTPRRIARVRNELSLELEAAPRAARCVERREAFRGGLEDAPVWYLKC